MEKNYNLNQEHIKLLIAIANADSALTNEEKLFITSKALEFNIQIPENYANTFSDLSSVKQFTQIEAENLLSDIVYLMMLDGAIHKQEYLICSKIAELLGLNNTYLDHIIVLVEKLWKRDINNC